MCHEVKALCRIEPTGLGTVKNRKGEEKTNIKYSIPYKNKFI